MEEAIREALSKGVEMHLAGEFDLASQLFDSILKLQPEHADANHNMGLLKLDMGQDLDALPYLQIALQADMSIAQFWLSYIKALIKLAKLEEAARILDLAKDSGFEGEDFKKLHQSLNSSAESGNRASKDIFNPNQTEIDSSDGAEMQNKAKPNDFAGRWREIISDPLNLLIERHPKSGLCDADGYVYLHNGNKVQVVGESSYYGEFSKVLVFNRGVHEPLEEFCFQEMLKKLTAQNPVMIELGSYWAHYSMWFKKKFPDSNCYMVEESKKCLNVGRHNFSFNNILDGEFILSKVGNDGFKIDDFTKEKGLDSISVLHSDIQGWELEMIDGAKDFLGKQAASYIFLSTHSQKIHEEAIQKLVSFGYIIEVSSDFDNHTTSYDGFILATAPLAERVFQNFQPFGRSEISAQNSSGKLEYLRAFNASHLKNPQNIDLNFGDGRVSKIDEDVHKLIISFQNELSSAKSTLPFFWDLSTKIKGYSENLLEFYSYVLRNQGSSTSQLFQDLFVLFIHNEKKNGTFLEFGATNGKELSNSLILEEHFGWTGVLAEPSPQWHSELHKNRTNTTILTECIYSETGKQLDFFVSERGVLSTLEEFKNSDAKTMPGNTKARNASGYTCVVDTISLNDVILKYFNGAQIDYMSVDTEGSELLILKSFDFVKYAPKIVTVEHNFTESQNELDDLFSKNNYRRYFKDFSQFDAWYVREE